MMSEIIDASSVSLSGSRILFDTNIWILIFDFDARSVPHKMEAYSDAYGKLLKSGNTIIINDYILGEFCNRCTRIQYETDKRNSNNPAAFPNYKEYRGSDEFRGTMEAVRDTCLNIVDDHEFVGVADAHYDISTVIETFCDGGLDFSDIILTEFCKRENLYLMTDDRDFGGRGLRVITANRRLLQARETRRRQT
jgi:predicted nucleic acid-binding protein